MALPHAAPAQPIDVAPLGAGWSVPLVRDGTMAFPVYVCGKNPARHEKPFYPAFTRAASFRVTCRTPHGHGVWPRE